jgi:membrane protein DedA with SNARE-associated domain
VSGTERRLNPRTSPLVSVIKGRMAQDLKIFRSILYLVLLAAFSPRTQSIAFNLTIAVFPFSLLVPIESIASTAAPAVGTSNIFNANFAVASPPAGIDRVPTTVSNDLFHYRKEHIELREIFYQPFALLCFKICAPGANLMTTQNSSDSEIPPAKARRAPSSDNNFLCGPFDLAQDMLRVPSAVLRTCFAGYIPNLWLRLGRFAFSAVDSSPGGSGGASAAPGHQQSAAVRRFERAIARVQPLLQRYGYGAAFAAVMVEGMGIPTPGQTLLMASALEATEGRMNIVLLLLLVTIAATLGNSVGYAIGRWGGRVALNKLKVNPQRQHALDDLFHRRGGIVILLARFVDGLRQLNGIVAGVLRMPWWTFTAYNVAGAVLWSCAWGLGTYYLGRDIHVIAAFFARHRPLLLVLGAAAFVALMVYLLRTRNSRADQNIVEKY